MAPVGNGIGVCSELEQDPDGSGITFDYRPRKARSSHPYLGRRCWRTTVRDFGGGLRGKAPERCYVRVERRGTPVGLQGIYTHCLMFGLPNILYSFVIKKIISLLVDS